MTAFRTVTDTFCVSPQITTADVAAAAAQGVSLIINNRPDGEAPDQTPGAAIAAAAEAAGLAYVHIPVAGRPGPAQVNAMREAMAGASGKVLAYCRSGTRSITTWAMGADAPRDRIVSLCAQAGYDVAGSLA
jgi:uncharacterized protein (TIGR01244 family)